MPKKIVTLDLDLPEGFKTTGEYRNPKEGEWFVSDYQDYPVKAEYEINVKRIILRKDELPEIPKFLGCIRDRNGLIIFVTDIGISVSPAIFGLLSNGKVTCAVREDAELYDHPDCPNSKELLSYFGW